MSWLFYFFIFLFLLVLWVGFLILATLCSWFYLSLFVMEISFWEVYLSYCIHFPFVSTEHRIIERKKAFCWESFLKELSLETLWLFDKVWIFFNRKCFLDWHNSAKIVSALRNYFLINCWVKLLNNWKISCFKQTSIPFLNVKKMVSSG